MYRHPMVVAALINGAHCTMTHKWGGAFHLDMNHVRGVRCAPVPMCGARDTLCGVALPPPTDVLHVGAAIMYDGLPD